MRILFISSTRIGDAVLSTGLLEHLRKAYPKARFTVCCGPVATPVFEGFPALERLIPVQKKSFSRHWLSLWMKVGFRKWDMVVDLRRSIMPYIVRKDQVFGTGARDKSGHKIEELSRIIDADKVFDPVIWPLPAADKDAKTTLKGKTVIALGAGANWEGKRWSAEKFVRLSKKLTSSRGPFPEAHVAVFGDQNDRAKVKSISEMLPPNQVLDFVGKVDLKTTIALIKQCDIFIGNDSGLMHIAAAQGVPTVGLFGPGDEEVYGPWSNNRGGQAIVVRTPESPQEIVTSPEFDHKAPKSYMGTLHEDTVYKAVNKFVKSLQKEVA